MIQCDECGAWFFTLNGFEDHNNFCIGYIQEGEEQTQKGEAYDFVEF